MSTFFRRLHRGVAIAVSAAVTAALAVVVAPAAHAGSNTTLPSNVNIRLATPAFDDTNSYDASDWVRAYISSGSKVFLNYLNAGGTLNLKYKVTNADNGDALPITPVTLIVNAPWSCSNASFTIGDTVAGPDWCNGDGSTYVSGTTDSDGYVTFDVTNTNTDAQAEARPAAFNAPSDKWAAGERKANIQITAGAAHEDIDILFTHIIKNPPAPVPLPANVNIRLASPVLDGTNSYDASDWVRAYISSGSKAILHYLNAGGTMNLKYQVTNADNGAVVADKPVTLIVNAPYACANASFTVGSTTAGPDWCNGEGSTYVSGTTDAEGYVTFDVTNTNTDAQAEERPADLNAPSDKWGAGERKANIQITAGATHEDIDILFTHILKNPPAPTEPPAVANIRLSSADKAHMSNKTYWYPVPATVGNFVKFVEAGSDLSFTYVVTDGDDDPVANIAVTLNCGGNASFTGCVGGKMTGTTNSNGEVTFTLHSTTANGDAEPRPVAPSSMDWWDDSRGVPTEVKFDFTPTVGAATENFDRLWTHTVKAFEAAVIPVANIYLSAADKKHMVDKSYWWTNEAASHSMVKFVVAGGELALHYRVTDADGNGIGDTAVTLHSAPGGGCFTGDFSGTTDADGYVTFDLTSCTVPDWPHAEWAPVKPSTMYYWDDSRTVPFEVKYDFWPSVGASVEHIDRVWTHTVLPPAPAAPDAVGSISTTAGDRDISISFDEPYDGYSAITGYTVAVTRYASKGASRVVGTYSLGADETSFDYDRAINGVAYSFTVTATNANGTSDATTSEKVVAGVPDAPSIDNITAGNGKLTIEVSGGDGGATAHTYYGYSLDGGQSWVNSRKNTKSIIVVKKLTNGDTYSVRVRAFNKYGAGAASDTVDASPVADAPSAPKVSKFVTTSESITVYFRAGYNGGADITDFEYSLDGGDSWTSTGQTAGPFTIDGLDASTTYAVSVRAVNSTGSGAASAARNVTTRRG